MDTRAQRSLQVLAEPRRQSIVRLIWDQELSAGQIAERVPVSFPAVSQHLKKLLEAGLVSVRAEGRHRYYRARKRDLGTLELYLEHMWAEKLDRLKALSEAAETDKPPEITR